MAMSTRQYQQYRSRCRYVDPALNYSSPWPWALALAISTTIWVGGAWLIWNFA
jgi:hypothetical protein